MHYLQTLIFLHIIMLGKPKILLSHVPIYVNICENVIKMNKEAKWTECGCHGGYENCVQYFSRNTQRKASFRRHRHGWMRNSEMALKSIVWGLLSSVQEYDPVMCVLERV
jgi:hypothetical protein